MRNQSGKKRFELLLSGIIAVYFAVLAYYTPQYGSKARLFPVLVLSLGSLLLLLKFLAALSPKWSSLLEPKEQPQIDISEFEAKNDGQPSASNAPEARGSVWQVLLWLILSVALVYCLGILAGIFAATSIFFLAITRMRWYKAILSAGAFTCIIYLVFSVALNMRLYAGLWL